MEEKDVIEFLRFLKQVKETDLSKETLEAFGYTEREIQKAHAQIDEIANEFANPKPASEGKFKIPHKFLCEAALRGYESEGFEGILNAFYAYKEFDGTLDEDYCKTLVSLYEDENNYLYVHNTCYKYAVPDEEMHRRVQGICQNGLFIPHPERSTGSVISYTTMNTHDDTSLGIFPIMRYWAMQKGVVVLQIPKHEIDEQKPVVGHNGHLIDGYVGVVLPKYVVGYTENEKFIPNPVPQNERATYKYAVKDESSVISELQWQ